VFLPALFNTGGGAERSQTPTSSMLLSLNPELTTPEDAATQMAARRRDDCSKLDH